MTRYNISTMKKLRRIVIYATAIIAVLFITVICLFYFKQEKFLFRPEVLTPNYAFAFKEKYKEVYITVEKDVTLHGLLFKAEKSKGLVFYLHGNGGSVKGWGGEAETFTSCGYDLFMLDYRGYGKSGGHITSEDQMHGDMQKVYEYLLKLYSEDKIIIAGYSIGTGPAAKLAANNKVKALLLQAPYNSLTQLIQEKAPFMPKGLIRYHFETYKNIVKVSAPVYIFHGTNDKLIPYSHSVKLKQRLPRAVLIPLPGEGHNSIKVSKLYKQELRKILAL